ncbi:hypothetical protein Hanom_Chr02g00108881 [Helianthus anomalus]
MSAEVVGFTGEDNWRRRVNLTRRQSESHKLGTDGFAPEILCEKSVLPLYTGKKAEGPHVPAWEKTMNIACYLSDPPKGFETFKSLIVGLNTCRLAHSLRENPVIREDWIIDLWYNSTAKKGDTVIKSKVQGTEVSISEQDIRVVLLFGDATDDPTEYSKEKVMEILVKMSYEGATPPPTIKKLLHPY